MNSGPPPDPNALRRERPQDKAGWEMLPAEGRKGRPPDWPLPPDLMLSTMLEQAGIQAEMLGAQVEAGVAPRGAEARLAKLDQHAALLRAKIDAATAAEVDLWRKLWATPQAVMWSRMKWTREVALYVRWQVLAELGDIKASAEARQWSDRLGVNAAAMQRLRWKVAPTAAAKGSAPPTPTGRTSARDRLKRLGGEVVEGGASA